MAISGDEDADSYCARLYRRGALFLKNKGLAITHSEAFILNTLGIGK